MTSPSKIGDDDSVQQVGRFQFHQILLLFLFCLFVECWCGCCFHQAWPLMTVSARFQASPDEPNPCGPSNALPRSALGTSMLSRSLASNERTDRRTVAVEHIEKQQRHQTTDKKKLDVRKVSLAVSSELLLRSSC